MLQARIERATEQLYGDLGLRDELADDEARILLQWGAAQIAEIAATVADDIDFDEACGQLRRIIKRINRFTARRAGMESEAQQAQLDKIARAAESIGILIDPERITEFLSQQGALDNIANIHAMTALVAPPVTDSDILGEGISDDQYE